MKEKLSKGLLRSRDIRMQAWKALQEYWVLMVGMMGLLFFPDQFLKLRDIELVKAQGMLKAVHRIGMEWDVTHGIPDGLIVFLFCAAAWFFVRPMIRFGVAEICRNRILKKDLDVYMLLYWRMIPKALISQIICALPCAAMLLISLLGYAGMPGIIVDILYIAAMAAAWYMRMIWGMRWYIWAEKPELGSVAALRESRRRMEGHRIRLLKLQLSYAGWLLSAVIGIAGLSGFAVVFSIGNDGLLGLIGLGFPLTLYGAPAIYLCMGETLFYMNLYACEEAGTDKEYIVLQEKTEPAAEAHVLERYAQLPADDEEKALAMLRDYDFSLLKLQAAGLQQEFIKLNVSPGIVDAWMVRHGDELLAKYPEDPEAHKAILTFAGEYADRYLMHRFIRRVWESVCAGTVPFEAALDHCLRAAETLNISSFSQMPNFVSAQKQVISRITDDIERRLTEADPGGSWKYTVQLLRSAIK